MGWAFAYVEALTLAQRLAGDDVMSRVFGVMESTMMASQAAGALAVPLLIAVFGPTGAITACGLGFGLVVAAAAPTLIRADRLVPSRVRQLQALRRVPMFDRSRRRSSNGSRRARRRCRSSPANDRHGRRGR